METCEAATAPAEVSPAGTDHVVTAVTLLPGLMTARACSDLHLNLQLAHLGRPCAERVEGEDVLTRGGAVVLQPAESAVAEATQAGHHAMTGVQPPGHRATPRPGTPGQVRLTLNEAVQPLRHELSVLVGASQPVKGGQVEESWTVVGGAASSSASRRSQPFPPAERAVRVRAGGQERVAGGEADVTQGHQGQLARGQVSESDLSVLLLLIKEVSVGDIRRVHQLLGTRV